MEIEIEKIGVLSNSVVSKNDETDSEDRIQELRWPLDRASLVLGFRRIPIPNRLSMETVGQA